MAMPNLEGRWKWKAEAAMSVKKSTKLQATPIPSTTRSRRHTWNVDQHSAQAERAVSDSRWGALRT
eukprot:COSAG01_NODE_714_length_14097_cov_6.044435_10_plen_66_part_00